VRDSLAPGAGRPPAAGRWRRLIGARLAPVGRRRPAGRLAGWPAALAPAGARRHASRPLAPAAPFRPPAGLTGSIRRPAYLTGQQAADRRL